MTDREPKLGPAPQPPGNPLASGDLPQRRTPSTEPAAAQSYVPARQLPDHLRGIGERIKAQKVVFLLGAGFSGYLAWQLRKDLEKRLIHAQECPSGWTADTLEKAAQTFEEKLGRRELERFVATRVASETKPASEMHRALLRLAYLQGDGSIITTNYDRLALSVCQEMGIPYRLVTGPEDLQTHEYRESRRVQIAHLHGVIDPSVPGAILGESILITEKDYAQYAKEQGRALATLVQNQFAGRYIVAVGFGLREPNFQRVMAELRSALHRSGRREYGCAFVVGEKHDFLEEATKQGMRPINCRDAAEAHELLDTLFSVTASHIEQQRNSVSMAAAYGDPTLAQEERRIFEERKEPRARELLDTWETALRDRLYVNPDRGDASQTPERRGLIDRFQQLVRALNYDALERGFRTATLADTYLRLGQALLELDNVEFDKSTEAALVAREAIENARLLVGSKSPEYRSMGVWLARACNRLGDHSTAFELRTTIDPGRDTSLEGLAGIGRVLWSVAERSYQMTDGGYTAIAGAARLLDEAVRHFQPAFHRFTALTKTPSSYERRVLGFGCLWVSVVQEMRWALSHGVRSTVNRELWESAKEYRALAEEITEDPTNPSSMLRESTRLRKQIGDWGQRTATVVDRAKQAAEDKDAG